jgi:hypothetical protein
LKLEYKEKSGGDYGGVKKVDEKKEKKEAKKMDTKKVDAPKIVAVTVS